MTYLLDTCIVSKLRKIRKYPDISLENWLSKHSNTSYFISTITIAEIQSGISKLNPHHKEKMILEDWLFGTVIPEFADRILPVDLHISMTWGRLIGENKKRGRLLPINDAFIAATAIAHNLILVTENSKDFLDTGAIIFNPWK